MNKKENETFGDWLLRRREDRGLSQSDLWRVTGISKQYINNLERNVRQPRTNKLTRPSEEKVDKFARALGVPISEARLAAGYAPPTKHGDATKGQRAAEYVDALPEDKQDDVLLFLEMLYRQYSRSTSDVRGERNVGTDKEVPPQPPPGAALPASLMRNQVVAGKSPKARKKRA